LTFENDKSTYAILGWSCGSTLLARLKKLKTPYLILSRCDERAFRVHV